MPFGPAPVQVSCRMRIPRSELPAPVAAVAATLETLPGTVAVVLGGSRASALADAASDWDLGLYYRGDIDLTALAPLGEIHPPGSWGPIMNGGAWLTCDGVRVDLILRDLNVVEHWTRRAEAGEFEVHALLGYLAGIPTYTLAAELASCAVLSGELPSIPYPERLAETAPPRWRFCRAFTLEYARRHAQRGNAAGAVGQTAKAIMEEGHAVLCERREWVCNEKRLIAAARLSGAERMLMEVPAAPDELLPWIDRVADYLDSVRPSDTEGSCRSPCLPSGRVLVSVTE